MWESILSCCHYPSAVDISFQIQGSSSSTCVLFFFWFFFAFQYLFLSFHPRSLIYLFYITIVGYAQQSEAIPAITLLPSTYQSTTLLLWTKYWEIEDLRFDSVVFSQPLPWFFFERFPLFSRWGWNVIYVISSDLSSGWLPSRMLLCESTWLFSWFLKRHYCN